MIMNRYNHANKATSCVDSGVIFAHMLCKQHADSMQMNIVTDILTDKLYILVIKEETRWRRQKYI